jgi:hypothetical protein
LHELVIDRCMKWYGQAQDVIGLSKAFPGVPFVLWDEEPEDLWNCCYRGGPLYDVLAWIEVSPFDPDEFVGSGPQPDGSRPRRGSAA